MKQKLLQAMVVLLASLGAHAQVNSGSNGSDGAFNPTTNTVINMADHPDGIYQYTSVNIPAGVTVSFIPNAGNKPVVWLVQNSVVIDGTIDVRGRVSISGNGGLGGPGGFNGGNIRLDQNSPPGPGQGPGGGRVTSEPNLRGGNASFGTLGGQSAGTLPQYPPGELYGNQFLVPLIGGSGGAGGSATGGGGGGGAILIAASNILECNGSILAYGADSGSNIGNGYGGGGSGGGVRLVATTLRGNGGISAGGGVAWAGVNPTTAGNGRIRMDALSQLFSGPTTGIITRGFQPIIIPPANQAVSLAIQNVAGIAVPQNPTGASLTPDVIVPGQQANPVSVVVHCVNIPLNTDIIIDVKPANGPTVSAVGANNTGTQASSTATVSVTMPRGAGTIQAKAVSGIAGSLGASLNNGEKFRHYAQTGLTADGELFAKMEITATLGSGQEIAYITESGKRFVLPRN